MDNAVAMFMVQSVLADPEGRAGVVDTAASFLESLGVTRVTLLSEHGPEPGSNIGTREQETGTPREIVALLVEAISQRVGAIEVTAEIEPEPEPASWGNGAEYPGDGDHGTGDTKPWLRGDSDND